MRGREGMRCKKNNLTDKNIEKKRTEKIRLKLETCHFLRGGKDYWKTIMTRRNSSDARK